MLYSVIASTLQLHSFVGHEARSENLHKAESNGLKVHVRCFNHVLNSSKEMTRIVADAEKNLKELEEKIAGADQHQFGRV